MRSHHAPTTINSPRVHGCVYILNISHSIRFIALAAITPQSKHWPCQVIDPRSSILEESTTTSPSKSNHVGELVRISNTLDNAWRCSPNVSWHGSNERGNIAQHLPCLLDWRRHHLRRTISSVLTHQRKAGTHIVGVSDLDLAHPSKLTFVQSTTDIFGT